MKHLTVSLIAAASLFLLGPAWGDPVKAPSGLDKIPNPITPEPLPPPPSIPTPPSPDVTTKYDRFRLWNDCEPMDLGVEYLDKVASEIGLTRERISTVVRSRLRAARLYSASATPYLYVNVNVVDRAFGISLEYNKLVVDLASGEALQATTWDTGGTGTHGRDSTYILSGVSEFTDEFIDEYLRVNEDACTR